MTFTGKLTYISPMREGISKAGNNWAKVDIVVTESGVNYPNELLLSANYDRLEQFSGIKEGDMVTVEYYLHVREYNGRRYQNASLYKIAKVEAAVETAKAPADKAVEYMTVATKSAPKPEPPKEPVYNDLPF